jgi:hypothetical protein
MRRMNCGKKRREECSEECADGKNTINTALLLGFGIIYTNVYVFIYSRQHRRRIGGIHGNI